MKSLQQIDRENEQAARLEIDSVLRRHLEDVSVEDRVMLSESIIKTARITGINAKALAYNIVTFAATERLRWR